MGSFKRLGVGAAIAALLLGQTGGAIALPIAPIADTEWDLMQIRHGGHHRPALGGHRPGWGGHHRPGWGSHHRPGHIHRPPGHFRPHYHGHWGRWHRPHYHWRPGGAIAAGAAIGFLSAAAAAAYAASAAPAAGLCWYYTDGSRRTGFWDVCP